MRKIKFRAWDKEKRKIVYFGLFSILVDGIENSEYWIKQYKNGLRNLEIMQCTGLKDKNGKEIFERDIIQHQNEEADNSPYIVPDITPENFEELLSIGDSEWEIDKNQYSNIEIIGNIYENKDLIK